MFHSSFTKQFMTLPQAADYLGLSTSCLYKKTHRREIPFYKPGNKIIYFKISELDVFAFSNRQASREELRLEVNDSLTKKVVK